MEAVAGIGNFAAGAAWLQGYESMKVGMLSAQGAGGAAAGSSIAASQSDLSVFSTSITAGVSSFMAGFAPAASNNELLGAILLMLILEYLKAGEKDGKKDLLALIAALAQQQQQGTGTGAMTYSSSSLNIESTQLQFSSTELAISAYSGAAATFQHAPGIDPGAAGLNVIA